MWQHDSGAGVFLAWRNLRRFSQEVQPASIPYHKCSSQRQFIKLFRFEIICSSDEVVCCCCCHCSCCWSIEFVLVYRLLLFHTEKLCFIHRKDIFLSLFIFCYCWGSWRDCVICGSVYQTVAQDTVQLTLEETWLEVVQAQCKVVIFWWSLNFESFSFLFEWMTPYSIDPTFHLCLLSCHACLTVIVMRCSLLYNISYLNVYPRFAKSN